MHQTQYNHLINVLHYEVAKATERLRICLLKTASITGKEYLLDLKTFLLRVCSPDQTRLPKKTFQAATWSRPSLVRLIPACSGE